jgi:signal transduction histidine kinase
VALALLCFAKSANALGPNRMLSQYIQDHWSIEQGFPGGLVYAFAQTPDGYLWIGTEKGLVRFDGMSFRLIQEWGSPALPIGPVQGLAVDAEGDLWVRVQGARLLRYHDGEFENVLPKLKLAEFDVTAMCVGNNGEILISALENGVVRYSKGEFVTLATRVDLPRLVISIAQTPDGKVWIGSREQGLYYLENGRVFSVSKGVPDKKINALLAVDNREVWISTDGGVVRWNGTGLSPAVPAQALGHVPGLVMTGDHDSNIWVGTAKGLARIDANGVASSEQGEIEGMGAVTALFEDREGNLWVGSSRGIERLRDSVFTTYSDSSGLPSDANGPVYVDSKGRTWFAPLRGGLYWLKNGQVGRVADGGLDKDVVYSIGGRNGELWIGRQRGGLTRLHDEGDSFTSETYTHSKGLAENSIFAVHESRDGTVWAGTLNAGLSRFKDGSFKTYTTKDGLGSNSVDSILESSDGTMWFGTPNGLSSFWKGQWRNYNSRDGLPPGGVNCLFEDSTGVIWIGTSYGLAFFKSGAIHIPSDLPEALREEILGIEADTAGLLWIATTNHILRVDRDKLLREALADADVREYGLADGLRGMQGVKRYRSVVADPLGQIWLSTNRGLSSVDPRPMPFSSAPAMVHVEGISADGRAIHLAQLVRIPAPHQRITLSYTGLSLSVPERVRFKYRLDGFDQGWSEPTAAREAVYTNLDSGSYRFHVTACNSDGVWNSSESTLQFEIEPVFWQTWWFRSCVLLGLAIAILVLVRLRMLKLAKQLGVRFEERLAERTRIAQELHDTLLQGFLSASMQLHVANDHLPSDSPAKPLVGRVLELMATVIDEGRHTVRGLRSSKLSSPELERAFLQIREEFPVESQIAYRVIVEGPPLPLRPVIRDEIYLIGHEALSNAFRHAHADEIEVEVEYAASRLRVFVRDNGAGIDPQILRGGRDGHWGLSGMKERTERIGGKLRVLSRAVAGTEVELSVPGEIAFELGPRHRFTRWLSKFYHGEREARK